MAIQKTKDVLSEIFFFFWCIATLASLGVGIFILFVYPDYRVYAVVVMFAGIASMLYLGRQASISKKVEQ